MTIKSAAELDCMRRAGEVVRRVKKKLREEIRPGVTTAELDRLAERGIRAQGAVPSFKGLYGFPATICASLNDEVVHGIPSGRIIQDGDVGAIVDGMHADSAFTVAAGRVGKRVQALIDDTEESLQRGIAQVRAGARVGDVSAAVQRYAEARGYGVVRQYVGHGIGRALHEDPPIPNHGPPGKGALLRKGMTIAIEPMLNLGSWETEVLDDDWTVVTADGELSAHFEHTVAITGDGAEVLT